MCRYSFFPFGIVIIGSFIVLVWKKPTNIFVWIITPFLLVHSIIPHKELRFLFPLMNFVPAIIISALAEVDKKQKLLVGTYFKVLVSIFLAINLAALATSNLKPADKGRSRIAHTINHLTKEKYVTLYYTPESNPFEPYKGITSVFYREPSVTYRDINSIEDCKIDNSTNRSEVMVVRAKDIDQPEIKRFIETNHFRKVSQSIPGFYIPFLKIYGAYKFDDILILYAR